MGNSFSIYTAVVGNYDEIKQPLVVDERFDFILFSNDIVEKQIGIWQVRPIPYFNPIQTKIARWVKTHPEELLGEYDASLWVDSNIIITSSFVYDRIAQLYQDGILVSTMKHFKRNCVYEEMFEILCCGFEREKVVLHWGQLLRKENYPRNNGLCETGVFFRIHSCKEVAKFDEMWWKCVDQYSRRDQFSVNYVLWKLGLSWQYFLPDGRSVYNSDCFMHVEHKDIGCVPQRIKRGQTEAWLVRYYSKCHNKRKQIMDLYYKIYGYPMPELWAFLYGQFFRFRYVLMRK